jgi:hypothetical protein
MPSPPLVAPAPTGPNARALARTHADVNLPVVDWPDVGRPHRRFAV